MKKMALAVKMTAAIALLAGCADLPQYVAPEHGATANLKSEIEGGDGMNDSINLYVSEGSCADPNRKALFYIRDSQSKPAGFQKIVANQPVRLVYVETMSGGRTCAISLDVVFEAGKNYSLVGGFAYKAGPIPILTGTRMCQFGVQNDADKVLVSRKSACSR